MSGWNAIGIQGSNAMYVRRGELRGMGQDGGGYPTFGEYDIISVAMDLDNLKCYRAKNNVWITIGGNPGDPTSGCVYPTSIVNYKDKIRIYSSASVGEHAQLRSDPDTRQGSIFMHELRKDGFIYLEPPGGTGEINTKWILWNSGELSINASLPYGDVLVEIMDDRGEIIPGYSYEDSIPFRGDSVNWEPKWSGNKNMSQLAGKVIKIGLRISNGRLYAVRGDYQFLTIAESRRYIVSGDQPKPRPGF